MRHFGFWAKLKKPIFLLAPMADVTDCAYRAIIARKGKPDVIFTEFVSCEGLLSDGMDRLLKDLVYSEAERPIVAQLFGSRPESFKKCANIIKKLGFDGIDINMGCPDRTIEKQGAGAALIKNHELAKKIIISTKEGAGTLPVSVKTRIGYGKDELKEWLPTLLSAEPAVISIHTRTRREMSLAPARWDTMKKAVEIRNKFNSKTLIIGNGDITGLTDGRKKAEEYEVDGVMLGRAIYGNPWLFSEEVNKEDLSLKEVISVLIEHIKEFDSLLGGVKSFSVMKKHFKAYIGGFRGAKDLRAQLMDTNTAHEAIKILENFNNT